MKRVIVNLLLLILIVKHGYASDYLKYNFIEEKNSYISSGYVEAYSDHLPFDIFDDDWDVLPTHHLSNSAFGTLYVDIHYNDNNNFRYGLFSEKSINININDGFIQTWYNATQDFNKFFTKLKDISTMELNTQDIQGDGSFYDTEGLFLQKIIPLKNNHNLSLKTKFYYADELKELIVRGYNNEVKFFLETNYFYTHEDILLKQENKNNDFNGYGYGFDLEYIYNDDSWYLYVGLLNIGAFIDWKSVTKQHLIFETQNKYKGDDGLSHVDATIHGDGYTYDINYKQKLPRYWKSAIVYKYNDSINIGENIIGYKDIYYNESYVIYKQSDIGYKLGYFRENKVANFGIYFKNINIEISNKFGSADTIYNASYDIKF